MEELMARYLADDLSEEEKTSFETQLTTDESVSQEFEAYLNVWAITHTTDSTNTFDAKAAWEAVEAKTSETKVLPITPAKRPYSFLKIAATIVLLAVAGYFVSTTIADNGGTESEMIELASERGVKEVTLPDGSVVRMNANTTLAYSKDFNSTDRKVLLSGEADFDVTHNADLPFIVEAGVSRIQVLGTSFDITAYPNETVELNVTEGRVAFSTLKQSDNSAVVTKGQMATLNIESNKIEVGEIEDYNFSGWWTRELVYENTPLKDVVKDLEKAYWVKFEYDEEKIGNCPVTSTHKNHTIDEVLQAITAAFPDWKYSKSQENKIKLSGNGCSD